MCVCVCVCVSVCVCGVQEDLGETLSSKSKVTLISLSTMERIQVRTYEAVHLHP